MPKTLAEEEHKISWSAEKLSATELLFFFKASPLLMGAVELPKLAAEFALKAPQVELEIVAEDRKVDPVEENYDIILRVNPDPDEQLVGRRIFENERFLVALVGAQVAFHSKPDDAAPRAPRWAIPARLPTSGGASRRTAAIDFSPAPPASFLVLFDDTRHSPSRRGNRAHAEAARR